jgi:hypothetical protein
MKIKDYFNIRELVDKDVYNRYGDKGWKFFCPLLLENLLILREGLNIPLVINNWYSGGKFSQRGLRHNRSEMVKNKSGIYLSPHMMGKAVDFHSPNMSSTDIRRWIKENEDLFTCKIRLEEYFKGHEIGWVHFDVVHVEGKEKVSFFNV